MKTTHIPVQVPDWMTHIAQDKDGTWHAFDSRPYQGEYNWFTGTDEDNPIAECDPNPN